MKSTVPPLRIRSLNKAPIRGEGAYVLYWMIATRRTHWNFGLQRAVEHAREMAKPLVVFEPLSCRYPWSSDRFHRFVIRGMRDNASRLERAGVTYHPWIEPAPGEGSGLLAALVKRACLVVTDDQPGFVIPLWSSAAARGAPVRFETVDSNGILPLRAADRVFPTAYGFRAFFQKAFRDHLGEVPRKDPLARLSLPRLSGFPRLPGKWEAVPEERLASLEEDLSDLPIDHSVPAVATEGGAVAAVARWRRFLRKELSSYVDRRSHPDHDAGSSLSPYLHFGHISPHQILSELIREEGWTPMSIGSTPAGKRTGWWGMSPGAEAFLDQLIVWRELGFNICWQVEGYDRYETLPDWALETLEKHAGDERKHVYDIEDFRRAATHDRVWNAAQRQLVEEGRLHNYMRMLWGKKILEWSTSPLEALEIMIELNNKYALDGRDPNSTSGIFWTLGRYDRPWFPERPVFGCVRYMSSASTMRKLKVRKYLDRYAPEETEPTLPLDGARHRE